MEKEINVCSIQKMGMENQIQWENFSSILSNYQRASLFLKRHQYIHPPAK